jgi:hypothetical protein
VKAPVWSVEWRLALRRRRLLALNVGIPILLVLPVALSGAPPFHAAAVYAVLFVLFGIFGSSIPLIRDGEGGLLRRMLLAGGRGRTILLERTLAGTLVDTIQLLPAALLALALGGAPAATWLLLPLTLAGALLAANLVGVWVAALARSLAEGALFAAVVGLFLLHGSGVFRTAPPGSVASWFEAVLPFGPLHTLLLAAAGATPTSPGALQVLAPTYGAGLALGLLTFLLADALMERIAPAFN